MSEAMAEPYDLLLGRRTYDIFAAHWPKANDPEVTPKFNAAIKFVFTSQPETLTWENSEALSGDVGNQVQAIRRRKGPDLSVQGSSELLQALLEGELVDQFNLWISPLVLGTGKRLFGSGAKLQGLSLEESTQSTTGVVINRYTKAKNSKLDYFTSKK